MGEMGENKMLSAEERTKEKEKYCCYDRMIIGGIEGFVTLWARQKGGC